MLVLSRKLQEDIRVGSEITIRVLEISGNRVRLGIECPKEIPVMRSELNLHAGREARPSFARELECVEG